MALVLFIWLVGIIPPIDYKEYKRFHKIHHKPKSEHDMPLGVKGRHKVNDLSDNLKTHTDVPPPQN